MPRECFELKGLGLMEVVLPGEDSRGGWWQRGRGACRSVCHVNSHACGEDWTTCWILANRIWLPWIFSTIYWTIITWDRFHPLRMPDYVTHLCHFMPASSSRIKPLCKLILMNSFISAMSASYLKLNKKYQRWKKDTYLVWQPSNIPVLMKSGHTIVVLTPSFPVASSSRPTDSAKPTAANLLAQ